MIVKKNCESCGGMFEYDEKPGYPRKYCFGCSAKKKDEYNNKKPGNVAQSAPVAKIGMTEGLSEVKHVFQNAYEFGKAGNRQTIRYWTIPELVAKVNDLKNAGFIDEEEVEVQRM